MQARHLSALLAALPLACGASLGPPAELTSASSVLRSDVSLWAMRITDQPLINGAQLSGAQVLGRQAAETWTGSAEEKVFAVNDGFLAFTADFQGIFPDLAKLALEMQDGSSSLNASRDMKEGLLSVLDTAVAQANAVGRTLAAVEVMQDTSSEANDAMGAAFNKSMPSSGNATAARDLLHNLTSLAAKMSEISGNISQRTDDAVAVNTGSAVCLAQGRLAAATLGNASGSLEAEQTHFNFLSLESAAVVRRLANLTAEGAAAAQLFALQEAFGSSLAALAANLSSLNQAWSAVQMSFATAAAQADDAAKSTPTQRAKVGAALQTELRTANASWAELRAAALGFQKRVLQGRSEAFKRGAATWLAQNELPPAPGLPALPPTAPCPLPPTPAPAPTDASSSSSSIAVIAVAVGLGLAVVILAASAWWYLTGRHRRPREATPLVK